MLLSLTFSFHIFLHSLAVSSPLAIIDFDKNPNINPNRFLYKTLHQFNGSVQSLEQLVFVWGGGGMGGIRDDSAKILF